MRSIEVLELINKNQIERLKEKLRDEIYEEALKVKPGARKRYSAMKKYFNYVPTSREALQKPCIVNFNGKEYTSFCNGFSLALTSEPCGAIELFSDKERYPDVIRLLNTNGKKRVLDLKLVLAEAKTKGYKLTKNEVNSYGYKYLLKYEGAYFKVGLLDATYAIIDDGEEATLYHEPDDRAALTIETSLGVCMIMPMRLDEVSEDLVVIEV